jgi:hypothetical protein
MIRNDECRERATFTLPGGLMRALRGLSVETSVPMFRLVQWGLEQELGRYAIWRVKNGGVPAVEEVNVLG